MPRPWPPVRCAWAATSRSAATAIAIERLKLELDRMTVSGRFAYAFASNNRPARLDAVLTAPEIDLDRVHALAKAVLGDTAFDWPREGTLSLKIAAPRSPASRRNRPTSNMRIDANGIEIDQLAIADFGGAALAVKGRIDTKAQSPRGAVTLDLDARSLDGVMALVDKFAPRAAEQLRRSSARLTPVTLRGVARGRSRSAAARVQMPRSRSTAAPAPSASRCKAMQAPRATHSRSTISRRWRRPR